ncbi:pilin [Candidatus Uhrbacteria bacterium]|nr:pilin [Candidatus Uhrbacteria bacterium]
MKHLTQSMWRAAVVFGIGVPGVSLAATNPFNTAQNLAGNVGNAAGVGEQKSLETIVGGIINVILGFLGIVLLGYMLYAGFLWMTAGGDDKKVGDAKSMIKNALIGLVIIVAAFAISSFVLGSLVNVTQQ